MSRAWSSADVALLDRASLASLGDEWEALAAGAAEPNPYYERWALLPALRTCAAEGDFRCLAVRFDGVLAALFPLQRVARYRGLPAAALRSWRHRHMLLCTPLVRADAAADAFGALLGWARDAGNAAILELDYFAADGPLREALVTALRRAACPWSVTHAFERALLRRAESAEAYVAASVERKLLADLRRRERRLKDAGRLAYVRFDGDAARWADDFLALEASGWKGSAGSALGCKPADGLFARSFFAEAAAQGRLLASGLDLDGRPIARRICATGGEGSVLFKSAYDEAYARMAPGLLAHLENIRAFHDQPAALRWMDSATAPGNAVADKMWKDRRRIERITAGVSAWGNFMLSLLPVARWARHKMKGAQPVAAPQ